MKRSEVFIERVKEAIISNVYYTYPKEYRQSDEYYNMPTEKKFQQGVSRLSMEKVLDIDKDEFENFTDGDIHFDEYED